MFTSVHFSGVKFLGLKVYIQHLYIPSSCFPNQLSISPYNVWKSSSISLPLLATASFSLLPPPPINYSRVLVVSHYWFNLHFSIMLNTFLHVCSTFRNPLLWNFYMSFVHFSVLSIQFSSVSQSCPTLWDPMNCSMPGLPVHHQLLESTQTHVHPVSDAIQPSHPLSSPSPPASNPFQH